MRKNLIEEYGLFEKDWLDDVKKGKWKPEVDEEQEKLDTDN